MPKKAPKNAFYFFMLDFKEQQQKKGINYANLAEVAKAADPEWRNAHVNVRTKYEDIAKKEKNKRHIPEEKYTSTGVPLSVVEQQQRDQMEQAEFEKQDIKNMVRLKAFDLDKILDEDIFVMDVNYYCKTDAGYVIGESTVLRFNMRNGFRDFYHVVINPGEIPFGYAFDVKLACQEYGLDMPDEDGEKADYCLILGRIVDYLKKSDREKKTVPPLYTLPEKVAPVQDFILQLCSKAGEDETLFRIYRLDTLFFTLINAIKTNKNEGFPKESLALLQLRKDLFKYTPKLGCEHHEIIDKSMECTTSRTKRWAYTVLDCCCPIVGIDIKSGLHLPKDFDLQGIMLYKEQKNERAPPTVAGLDTASTSFNSTLDESARSYANASTASDQARQTSDRRTHRPMRLPQQDYSREIRTAPELTEDEFPALSSGAGRGRGLANSFNRLNRRQ